MLPNSPVLEVVCNSFNKNLNAKNISKSILGDSLAKPSIKVPDGFPHRGIQRTSGSKFVDAQHTPTRRCLLEVYPRRPCARVGRRIRHRRQGNLHVFRRNLLKVRDRQVGVGRSLTRERARVHAALSAARPTPWRCGLTGAVTATL